MAITARLTASTIATVLVALLAATILDRPVSSQSATHQSDAPPFRLKTIDGVVALVRTEGLEGCELCEACEDCRAPHLVVHTRSDRVDVHLAPAWYLARLGFDVSEGDDIRVIGSRAQMPQEHGLAAHEIFTVDGVVRLRDEHGLPIWRRILTEAHAYRNE